MSLNKIGSMGLAWGLVICLGMLLPGRVYGGDVSKYVPTVKSATAMVRGTTPDGRSCTGTAFCINPSGVFIASDYIVGSAGGKDFDLVLHAAESDEQMLKAHVLREDKDLGLALIKVDNPPALTALSLGDSSGLVETMQVTAFGFPLMQDPATLGTTPAISVDQIQITSLVKKNGNLHLVQFESPVNPGNMGAPLVIGDDGNVVGVVQPGVADQSQGFFIPSSRIQAMLDKPDVALASITVQFANRNNPVEFHVNVMSYTATATAYTVKMQLGTGADARTMDMQAGDNGQYTVTMTPVAAPAGAAPVHVKAQFKAGAVECTVADQSFQVGGQAVKLSDIASLSLGDQPHATLNNSKEATGAITGLDDTTADFGGMTATINLGKAQSLTVDPPPPPSSTLNYRLIVNSGDREVVESSGIIPLAGAPQGSSSAAEETPAAVPVAAIGETPMDADVVQIKMPGQIDDVVAGAGGRDSFFEITKLRKLAVFDVKTGKIGQFISLPSDDCLVAADQDKLLIFVRDQKIIQRYDLRTMERDLTVQMPDVDQLDGVALGCASNGPLMVMTQDGPRFMDVRTLHLMEMKLTNPGEWMSQPNDPLMAHASADGTTFSAWQPRVSPTGIRLMVVNGNSVDNKYLHESAGALLPNFDGSLLFTGDGIYTADLEPVATDTFRGVQCIPAYDPNYFIGVRRGNRMNNGFNNRFNNGVNNDKMEIMVFSAGDHHLLVTLPDYDEMAPANEADNQQVIRMRFQQQMGLEQRIHFIPSANLIVTIPEARDQIYLHRFNVADALDKAGIDYLYVASSPLRTIRRGEHYQYAVNIKSKRGGVHMSLDSGPAGMTLSKDGILNWNVPDDLRDASAGVIVNISDASGQQIYHSFNINIDSNEER